MLLRDRLDKPNYNIESSDFRIGSIFFWIKRKNTYYKITSIDNDKVYFHNTRNLMEFNITKVTFSQYIKNEIWIIKEY